MKLQGWITLVSLVLAGAAQAADQPVASPGGPGTRPDDAPTSPITDRFSVRLGGWDATLRTEARIDPNGQPGAGTMFSAERDFGMPDRSRQFHGEVMFRLRDRVRLRFSGMELTRRADVLLDHDIQFGNQLLLAGERLQSRHLLSTMDFSLLYSLLRKERVEVGLGAGLHLMQTEVEGAIPARPTGAVFERFSGSGPYPDLAGDLTWRITRRFAFSGRAQLLQVRASGITARIGDYHADVQFRLRRYLAVGVGYQYYSLNVDAPEENPGGRASMDFRGPELFLRASL